MDHYEVLGVARTATTAEVNRAARNALWTGDAKDIERRRRIMNAWFTLRSAKRRQAYERQLVVDAPGVPTLTGQQAMVRIGENHRHEAHAGHRLPRHRA
jgi:DnaJ-class molecular chaperone